MNDHDFIANIKKITPFFNYEFHEDKCIEIDFTNKEFIFHGTIRSLSDKLKQEILVNVSNLKFLEKINFKKNRLNNFPNIFWPNLKHLDIASNYLKKVPDLSENYNLNFLNIGVNQLIELPNYFDRLKNIETLKLHKNKIKNIDSISSLKKIKFLNLYLNNIKEIPEFLFDFKELEFFSWGLTGIKTISDKIKNLNNLKWLSLVANKIEYLPDSFCELKNLIGLRLHKNKINRLPENFGFLKSLKQLTLYKNLLKNIPDSLYEINFEKLNLKFNPVVINKEKIKAKWFIF